MKFQTIRIEGAILAADILDKIEQGELKGQKPADFGITSTVKDDIARAWADAQDYWRIYQRKISSLPERQLGTTETRNLWMVPLLGLLGYKPDFHQKGEVVNEKTYALSHRDLSRGGFPIHVMGFRDSLDRKRQDSGPRMSPHGLLQEYLNLTEHLYAIVTNGLQLRLLRDSTRLVKLSYLEFDLEQMMEEGHFSDFAVMYRLLHATRMPVTPETSAESLIEEYHQESLDSGSRIRDGLSQAVEKCITSFANGFLRHSDNSELREAIESGQLDAKTYYQYQLRLIYRLLFLMVIEERNLVYPRNSDRAKRNVYYNHYSVSNLRRLAGKRYLADARYRDYWISLRNVFRLFEDEKYGAPLDIQPLAGDLFGSDAIRYLNICSLDNAVVIDCLTKLSMFEHPETHQRIRVNYASLNVEEFGSVYEGLLEYDPVFTTSNGKLSFNLVKGDERSTSGSHYTPDELVTPLIRNSLDHVIAEKLKETDKEKALLSITVCDVACGSGHILLNAARRIATEVAIIRTGEEQPSPESFRHAVRDVIRNCIYGVDINPLAVELCKVAMWLEAHNPNEPLNFLDHHIKCGNAIVGLAHSKELERGIPEEAFKKLDGDDKDTCKGFRDRNKRQRKDREAGQQVNYGESVGRDLRACLSELASVTSMQENNPKQIVAKHDAYEEWQKSAALRNLRITADLQVAQFFIPKTADGKAHLCTDETYFRHLKGELQLVGQAVAKAMAVSHDKRFFHWFVEFPKVFADGGFDCIVGNPPYLGGKKISGAMGKSFLNCIHSLYPSVTGQADLITYFLRQTYNVVSENGFVSLITTNTIAEGDTRAGGLGYLEKQGANIVFAVRSLRWPGTANLFIALLSVKKGKVSFPKSLDGHNVAEINSYLGDLPYTPEPYVLNRSTGIMYRGVDFGGDGFILNKDEHQKLYESENNREVLYPLYNGADINNSPELSPSRYIIHFMDWPLNKASQYQGPIELVKERVKPYRDTVKDSRSRKNWWLFNRARPELYKKLSALEECLVTAFTTKYLFISRVSAHAVYSNALNIVASDDHALFVILQSTIHEVWARQYGSKLKNDLRYTPSDCFDTYPFPDEAAVSPLVSLGEEYHQFRKELLLQLGHGLTKTYNLFHKLDLSEPEVTKACKNPKTKPADALQSIKHLRQLHVQLDNAVAKAYGWNDIDLAHDFYEVDYLPENDNVRFTISPDARREILQRLLKLNHERHAEEVDAGLHDKKQSKNKSPAKIKQSIGGSAQKELDL